MNEANQALFNSDVWQLPLEKYAISAHLTVKLFCTEQEVVVGPVHSTPLFQLFAENGYDPGLFAECARRCLTPGKELPPFLVSEFYGLSVIGTPLVLEGEIVGAAV